MEGAYLIYKFVIHAAGEFCATHNVNPVSTRAHWRRALRLRRGNDSLLRGGTTLPLTPQALLRQESTEIRFQSEFALLFGRVEI
jgi:hypothetical protein